MKTKIEIKSTWRSILFEYEKENNSIKETLIEAIKGGAYLGSADLRGADLGGANLYAANLYAANLYTANLGGADFGEWGKLQSSSDILVVGSIGSRNGYTIIFHTDKGVYVMCGCFKGTLDEFETKVKETHHGNKHERDYLALIQFAKVKFEL